MWRAVLHPPPSCCWETPRLYGCGVFRYGERMTIKSTAAHVLSTGEATGSEAASLAAYALGHKPPAPPRDRSLVEMRTLLDKIDRSGMPGQKERGDVVRQMIADMEAQAMEESE